MTDSQCCQIIVSKGSMKINLHEYAIQIFNFCQLNNIELNVSWIKRSINLEADYLSKLYDSDGWSVDRSLVQKMEVLSNNVFSIDLFASDENTKCIRFYSKFYCPGTIGVNAFNYSWKGEFAWICPPPSLALKVLNHILFYDVKGVLCIPEWVSLTIWPMLCQNNVKEKICGDWIFPGNLFLSHNSHDIFNANFRKGLRCILFL